MPSDFIILFLFVAAFLAGFIDSIAGGGGLITIPALLVSGLPPHLALGTNKFQSMFGTSFALANFARKRNVLFKAVLVGIPLALVGSWVGAKLALFIPVAVLARVIVLLLPPIALCVFISKKWMRRANGKPVDLRPIAFVCLIVGIYDGFLGPGTGSFLILGFVILSHMTLVKASATAKAINLASNVGAFAAFLLAGQVFFKVGLVMAMANICGNVVGSHFAMKHGDQFVQKILAASLTLLFIYLGWQYFL